MFNRPSALLRSLGLFLGLIVGLAVGLGFGPHALASPQYEPMAEQVRLALSSALSQRVEPPRPVFESVQHRLNWLSMMSDRLKRRIPDFNERMELIKTIRYEAQRAGLEPELVFAVIEVESNFRADAVSSAGAIGLMQIMPFWTQVLSDGDKERLFEPALNIRYGCLILAHYLDIENGNRHRALARYNGSLGKDIYPDKVNDKLYANWR